MTASGAQPTPSGPAGHDEKPAAQGFKAACNVRAKMAEKERHRLYSNTPDPWVVRKFVVGLVWVIFGYALYAFLVDIVISMIRQTGPNRPRGSQAEGIVLLVIWCFLWIMFVVTYLRVIFATPGYAKDVVPQTEKPEDYDYGADESTSSSVSSSSSSSSSTSSYSTATGSRRSSVSSVIGRPYEANADHTANGGDPSAMPAPVSPVAVSPRSEGRRLPSSPSKSATVRSGGTGRHDTDAIAEESPAAGTLGPIIGHVFSSRSEPEAHEMTERTPSRRHRSGEGQTTATGAEPSKQDTDGLQRRPPPFAVLTESYRYCTRCQLIKPYRTHHCRHCGTCVLKMDHHCAWVGSCVGARNYKYFYNFLQWSSLFCLYVFAATFAAIIPPHRSRVPVDARQIVLLLIAFLFALFTGGLLGTHTWLMFHNITTIEEMAITRMKRRENATLQTKHGWFDFKGRSRTRKRWNHEWGNPHSEGNLWWLGDARKNWEMVMGQWQPAWFLPIPARPGDDGLHYVPNPRFADTGRWRKREQWPEKLR